MIQIKKKFIFHPLLVASIFVPGMALAQNPDSTMPTNPTSTANAPSDASSRYSWIPFTTHGYVGASVGEAKFDIDCASGFSCDRKDTGFKIFSGGKFRDVIGLELSYLDMGEAERAGGTTRARGVNLSVIGNLPLHDRFSIFGRLGSTYGWTKTDSSTTSISSGKERGFGLAYGAGVNFDLATNWALRAEWERHRFEFANEDSDIDLYTIGFNYKF